MTDAHRFRLLIDFGAEAARLLQRQGVRPIVYGSLAYLAHTRDESQGVHDIDFLVPAPDRERLAVLLVALVDVWIEPTTYHSTKVHRGDLVISFDEIERFRLVGQFATVRMTVAGQAFTIVNSKGLEAAYQAGAATIPAKVDAYALKLKRLREHNPS